MNEKIEWKNNYGWKNKRMKELNERINEWKNKWMNE